MTSGADEDADAVLSDVESDEPAPVVLNDPPPREEAQDERLTELIAELDREKKAREAAESSKSDLQASFNRLKALAHEAIKKRDESKRERDEALKEKENLSKELESVSKGKDEVLKKLDEAVRSRDGLKAEIETSSHMLVSGIEKISGKVSSFKNFSNGGGLPKSQKYTGLASVAYGVIKRTHEIVEELVKQIDTTAKSRNEAREQMDQRNYEIAIEVSQLESTISNLRLEVAEKASLVDDLERDVSEKDKRVVELEKDNLEKVSVLEGEVVELKQLVDEYDGKLKTMEMKIVAQRPLLMDQLSLVSKIHDQLNEVVKIVDGNSSEQSESFFMPQETDMEENIRASLAGMESIFELTKVVSGKTQSLVEEKSHEVKKLSETVGLLVKEKEHIGTLLRSALSKRMISEQSSQKSEMFQAAENGLRDVGIDFKSKAQESLGDSQDDHSTEENEIYSLASTLENIVKASQLKIVELQHSLEESREEISSLRKQLDSQTKELNQRMRQIEELKEKERIANENVEGLMTDIAAAEEEIERWKVAAEQEAAAGGAVEQDFTSQLHVLKEELEEAKQAIKESEKKLKFKEETAAAAMGARDAAERSLKLADNRATRLRERIQDLNRKIEELETHRDMSTSNRARYVCWPWQLLGIDFVGGRRIESEQEQSSNEMELAEPLL
ncbi:paramyosin-like [Brassica napus]|uniref:paramyosin-like n=1 Tax=Brassica napus TaxID=3708 RepID=UPI0006AA6077|nr:paramyosin-like [Brassica napus]XP_048596104.1 paramyosin-like [Brassica napus]XP_048596106.1 paramyosin-like [Brassica napus]